MLRSTFAYDLAGRQVSQADYDPSGSQAVYERTASYDAKGRLASDATYTIRTDGKTYNT